MEHVQRKMTQIVRERETKLYEKQLEEAGRFSRKKRRLTRKYYRDHSFQILAEMLHGLGIHHALPTGASQNEGHCGGDTGRTSKRT